MQHIVGLSRYLVVSGLRLKTREIHSKCPSFLFDYSCLVKTAFNVVISMYFDLYYINRSDNLSFDRGVSKGMI